VDEWITLEGIVELQQIAVESAIRSVINHVNVKPVPIPSEVKTQIESAKRRAAERSRQEVLGPIR